MADRDAYAQQSAELLILQQVFTAMNSTMQLDDILAMVLRGVHEALGFGRVVLFDVQNGVARRHLECDGDDAVMQSDAGRFVSTVTLQSIAAGEGDFALGIADDGESPLPDGHGAYCLLPLVSRGRVCGLLYVDKPSHATISETQIQVLFDFAAQAALVIENARLYNETRRLLEEAQALASTDALTGLVNRRALGEQLERELFNAERYKTQFAVMMLDLDDLKRINDTGGHSAGDDALRRFASALKRSARKGDIVARYGGDEFMIVMVQADHAAAEIAARRVFDAIHAARLRCSAGLAVYPLDGINESMLIAAADDAVYKAKRNGKDAFEFASLIVR